MKISRFLQALLVLAAFLAASSVMASDPAVPVQGSMPWWGWPVLLFVFTFLLGMVAIAAGVGGGVLFVPIVSSFFPFHIDFVRGAGLMVALAGALSAGPGLLKRGLADLRLAMPLALIASTSSIFGAMAGLAMDPKTVQIALGSTIMFIVLIMARAQKSDFPQVKETDRLARFLGIGGSYYCEPLQKKIDWKVHHTPRALLLFVLIGFLAGMFGLGAGFANTPVLNLLMGAPLKIAVGTSVFILSITDTTAAWVYLNKGAILPIIVVPAVAGMMLGTRIGVLVLAKSKPSMVKKFVLVFLTLAGARAILKGLGI